ncbi:MAG: hypothetical protein A2X81_06465 [Desulfobacterales bacterium GWB2_56_26]|nr:MAG: hypothetical protein A2X81_06465 [Desulfobacterales bacterium GWB2_56_26]
MELPQKDEVVPLSKIEEICRFYGLHDLWDTIQTDRPAKPFVSDGCSLWVDCWKGKDIYPACFRHDLKYWAGRPGEDIERLKADCTLMLEVADATNDIRFAETMFFGVRLGGHEILKQPFSWGFGRR